MHEGPPNFANLRKRTGQTTMSRQIRGHRGHLAFPILQSQPISPQGKKLHLGGLHISQHGTKEKMSSRRSQIRTNSRTRESNV
nr:uncharacterized protein LOC114819240 isoform X2 [Malus domestica]